jgi:transcriptional regulator with XRE-family HTH domain
MDTGLPQKKLKRLAQNCHDARAATHMGAEEVAAKLGMSVGYVYQLERAQFNPPLAILVKLRSIYKLKSLKPFLDGI